MSEDCRNCGQNVNHLDHSRGICKYVPSPKKPKEQKPLAPRSEKMAEFYRTERIPLIEQVFARDGYRCQIESPAHDRISDWNFLTVHEIGTRGREGGIMAPGVNTLENCVTACRYCNSYCSEDSDWAEEHGWLKPASPTHELEAEGREFKPVSSASQKEA